MAACFPCRCLRRSESGTDTDAPIPVERGSNEVIPSVGSCWLLLPLSKK